MLKPIFAEWGLQAIPIRTDSWLVFTVVLVGLIVFIWLIARLITRVTDDTDPAETDRQMLTSIAELHRKGDLSQEEFRSIKSQLVERLRNPIPSAVDESDQTDPAESANIPDTSVERDDPLLDSETASGEDNTLAT